VDRPEFNFGSTGHQRARDKAVPSVSERVQAEQLVRVSIFYLNQTLKLRLSQNHGGGT
jgi:hypothetical protein